MLYTNDCHQDDKYAQMYRLSTEVKSTSQMQYRDPFTLILGNELFSLSKTLLWLWDIEQQ